MHFSRSSAAAALAVLLPAFTSAQTFTDCDATKESCKPEVGLPSTTFISDFTKGGDAGASWSKADGTSIKYGGEGAEYTIVSPGQAPTVASDFTIFYGKVEVVMKAAPGVGIVSSIVLESSVLDEIDWEFLGSRPTQVQTNYYGLANTTTYDRVAYHQVADTQASFHTYTIDWNPSRIEFLVDGTSVRTLPRASTAGRNYPQTPMHIKFGNWAAGGPGMPKGTVEWGGGETDFEQGPFTMVVKSVAITNYNPACEYVYSDRSGSDTSIDIITTGESCVSGEVADPKPALLPGGGDGQPAVNESSTVSSVSLKSATKSAGISTTTTTTTTTTTPLTPTASSAVSTAAETATEAPTLSQMVANIVPTAYYNSTGSSLASSGTVSTSASQTGTIATTTLSDAATGVSTESVAASTESAAAEYTGAAKMNEVVGGMRLFAVMVVVVAGLSGL